MRNKQVFGMQRYADYGQEAAAATSISSTNRDGALSSTLRDTSRPRSSSRASSRMANPRIAASPTLTHHPSSNTFNPVSLGADRGREAYRSSDTWTSSSGDLGVLSDTDEIDDRGQFLQEYNRLALKVGGGFFWAAKRAELMVAKHGLRPMVPGNFEPDEVSGASPSVPPCDATWLTFLSCFTGSVKPWQAFTEELALPTPSSVKISDKVSELRYV
jgi:hypothetical protein